MVASRSRSSSLTQSGIMRSILLAFGVVIFLFVIFEIVEYVWLENLDMDLLHVIYVARGLTASLVAAVLVGWLIVRASGPLLPTKEWTIKDRPIREKRVDNFNRWFIFMRWIAVLIAALLVFIVVRVNQWLPMAVWWPLMITIGCLALLNSAYMWVVHRGNWNQYLLPFQAYTDLVILTVLLHFSGGIENPLSLLLLIHIIIAGIVLSQKHLYAVTTTAIILLIIMAVGEATGIFQHYTLNIFPHYEEQGTHIHAAHMPLYVTSHVGLMVTIFLLTAYFIGTIMNRIRHDEQQLEIFADQSLEQRQLIEKALETTDTGLCVCDNSGNPFWINPIWETWFGEKSIDCIKAGQGTDEPRCISETLEDGESHVNEVTMDTEPKNQTKIFRITTAPLFDKDGNIDHAVSLAKDITDQKEAQEQMLRAGKLAAVGELAGEVAHEVNNPIGVISAKCRLLLSDHSEEMSEKVSRELKKITNEADRVSNIAKGLLSYCRPSTASREELNIRIPINNALSIIKESAKRNGVKIEKKLPDQLSTVKANADEMQQVFLNLFLNALDAMQDGGRLIISADQPENAGNKEGRFLTIFIKDTGTGIPEQTKQQIFEPFFTTKEEGEGTGLGLSICAGIIRSHDGTIDIKSSPGHGTTVILQIPVY